jgi:hypothetical protein
VNFSRRKVDLLDSIVGMLRIRSPAKLERRGAQHCRYLTAGRAVSRNRRRARQGHDADRVRAGETAPLFNIRCKETTIRG